MTKPNVYCRDHPAIDRIYQTLNTQRENNVHSTRLRKRVKEGKEGKKRHEKEREKQRNTETERKK